MLFSESTSWRKNNDKIRFQKKKYIYTFPPITTKNLVCNICLILFLINYYTYLGIVY